MQLPLQIALFLASVAFIVLVACLIPLAFQVRRQLDHLALTADQLKEKLEVFMEDSHALIRNVSDLSQRASQKMDTVDEVVHTVRQWTERADRIVNEVGAVIEPPVFSAVRNMNLLRVGVTTFLNAILHRNHHNQTIEKKDHV